MSRCEATTRKGTRCRNVALTPEGALVLCRVHLDEWSRDV